MRWIGCALLFVLVACGEEPPADEADVPGFVAADFAGSYRGTMRSTLTLSGESRQGDGPAVVELQATPDNGLKFPDATCVTRLAVGNAQGDSVSLGLRRDPCTQTDANGCRWAFEAAGGGSIRGNVLDLHWDGPVTVECPSQPARSGTVESQFAGMRDD